MTIHPLQTPITQLPGIGPKRADAFGRLGIFTFKDLLFHFPRAHEDRTSFKKIIELAHDETVCIKATVVSPMQTNLIRKNMRISSLRVSDGTGFLELIWFNNRFLDNRFKKGEIYIFYGKVRLTPKKQMVTPLFETPDNQKQTGCIVPLYPLTEGLTEKVMSDCVEQALSRCGQLKDPLPIALRSTYQLCELNYALTNIHFPAGKKEYETARQRLAFEELFTFQVALCSLKKRQTNRPGAKMSASYEPFLRSLPFTPTDAQQRVIQEITKDLASGLSMNRLVCGDVGSGKTAVAAAATYITVKSGYQAAFMAPTEILAQQHYEGLQKMFHGHNIEIELLSGSLTASQRRKALERIHTGQVQVVIGTHALLSDDVHFNCLGLAITDEQHRFGVNQRRTLSEKGENTHVLVMSATPIPRTLAFILYGDLDISIIDELPPGRQKIDTFAVGESYRKRIYAFLAKELAAGRQAYIVCPLVEESEVLELESVKEYAQKIQTSFPNTAIGVLHGKMKPAEKEAIMLAFKQGELRILVATSVIEVGVDVPNATFMLIENAERYGLSQLHQLRGRVGRGTEKSYCILLSQSNQETAVKRLNVMKNQSDGFSIAEEDLKQRGPGDFFGTKQHGLPAFKLAGVFSDMELLSKTTQAAKDYLENKIPLTEEEKSLILEKINDLFNNHVTIS